MAITQLKGSEIITLARALGNDDDAAGNYAISDAKALVLLNDILNRFAHCFTAQARYYGASTTGLTFPAGTTTILTSASSPNVFDLNGITSAHQSSSGDLATVLAAGLPTDLPRLTVPDLIAKYDRDNQDTAIPQSSTDWEYWAAEREGTADETNGLDKWRFWVYPALNRTQYLTLKAVERGGISATSKYPNISATDAKYVARLLAYEMAIHQKDLDANFLQNLLAPLPKALRDMQYGNAVTSSQAQDSIEWTVD